MGPKVLAEVLKTLPDSNHPDLMVGFNKADDAGVFRISDDLALVQTVDFFPPIVDDPYWFGQIAAANALSDIYAMGGKPLTALNIVGFPSGDMPPSILTEILRGGNDKVVEAGAVVVGGHSVKDKELKFGISVTGSIHPDKIVTNAGAQVGDKLYLTKPLGTGIISTAIKRDAVDEALIETVQHQMATLNNKAAEMMIACDAHAATDITGFGLLGHTFEMASASNVTIRINASVLPVLPGVIELARAGMNPGGAMANREYLEGKLSLSSDIDDALVHVLFDPQTSGGLLIALSPDMTTRFEQLATERNITAPCIGTVEDAGEFDLVIE